MNVIPLLLPLLYSLLIIGLCAFLLVKGITHSFLLCFLLGAILHAASSGGFALMQQASGGFSANMRWMPALSAVGMLGTLASAAGFVLLAVYLLKNETPRP